MDSCYSATIFLAKAGGLQGIQQPLDIMEACAMALNGLNRIQRPEQANFVKNGLIITLSTCLLCLRRSGARRDELRENLLEDIFGACLKESEAGGEAFADALGVLIGIASSKMSSHQFSSQILVKKGLIRFRGFSCLPSKQLISLC